MNTLIRTREIDFYPLHPDPNQAQSASHLLEGIDGIECVRVFPPVRIEVRYDLTMVTLQEIELALMEVGFHLDNNLFAKLRRALYYYTEETLRANLGMTQGQGKSTRDVFVKNYQSRPHGCRDERPDHWRSYL